MNAQTNYCNNNLLILDIEQLNKIMKLYYFYTLKALWDGQGKFKIHYGMCKVKKQLSGKRSIKQEWFSHNIIFTLWSKSQPEEIISDIQPLIFENAQQYSNKL